MANTTNYNWETPDDTDLVKDGAAAIRTLGSSVDTTTKALNPSTTLGDIEYRSATANTNTRLAIGTTGQVLTVAGGVPTWATSDDANAIQNAIVDAKGDLIAATAADTPARLAVGTNGQVLTADSAEATGLKWATAASGGGQTLISTTALTGASITLSSIPGTYKHLYLILKGVYLATTGNCEMQFNADTGTNYNYSYVRYRDATVGVGYNYSANTYAYLFEAPATNTGSKLANCEIVLPRYTDTSSQPVYTRSYGSNATQVVNYTTVGSYANTAAITEIKLIPQYNFSSGTAYLYGVS